MHWIVVVFYDPGVAKYRVRLHSHGWHGILTWPNLYRRKGDAIRYVLKYLFHAAMQKVWVITVVPMKARWHYTWQLYKYGEELKTVAEELRDEPWSS